MSGIRIEGNTSGNVAEVDANNNLKANLPTTAAQAGYALALIEQDPGTITGSSLRRSPWITSQRRLAVGLDTPIFDYTFNATAQDTGVWKHVFTTMTCTQSSGSVLFNANSTATTATGCALSSWRYFQLLGGASLRVSMSLQITAAALTNEVWEAGLFLPATSPVAAPTDGIYYRYSSAGLIGVINYNGVETTTSVLLATITPNTVSAFIIIVGEGSTEFWIDMGTGPVLYGTLATPAAQSEPFATTALPIAVQYRNSNTVSGSPQMQLKWSDCSVIQRSLQLAAPYSHQMALQKGAGQGLSGGTMGSLALYTNSLAPGAGAAMTNTTAALGTGLGGQFATLPTLAANTDGIVCSYQNPAGSATQTPRTFMCTGVRIQSMVTTVLVGGPVQYFYSLAYGHTAVSMATAESGSFVTNTAKAPRRIPIGMELFAAAAAVGTIGSASGQYMAFNSPIPVNPGEFIAICAKNVGTVTTSGVITFLVTFDGYWI